MIRPSGYQVMTRRLGVAAALAGLLAAGACDAAGLGDKEDVTAGGGGSAPKIDVSFAITGAVLVTGYTTSKPASDNGPAADTCAGYAKGAGDDGELHFVLPSFMDAPVEGKKLFVGALVDNYTGPGRYEKKNLKDQGSPPGIDVDGTLYLQLTDSKSEVTVDEKGGGTWTFSGLVVRDADGTDGDKPIDGTMKWTCNDQDTP